MKRRSIPFGKPIMGEAEKEAVLKVMDTGHLVHGPVIKEFESAFSDFTKAPYVIGVSSCTAALHLTYFVQGVGPGDEVIVPAMTHTATAHAIEYGGAKVVFVDAELETGNIDIDLIEAAITDRTRAISIVHFLGVPVDMQRVIGLAEKYNLFVVEDCALAIGSRINGTHAGLFGAAGCFSFYPVKHMTTAEGGVLITRDEELAGKIAHQRAFGVDREQTERSTPGQYDVTALGYNYRMSEIHAALGVEQLKRVGGFLAKRKENYEALAHGLRDVAEVDLFRAPHENFQSSHYCLSVILKDSVAISRGDIISDLKARGVGTSIYYPRPVPFMSYYRAKYMHRDGEFPVAARIADQSIALPVGPHLGVEEMAYIAQSVKEAICSTKRS
jgi:dTDP-4-amino-4,6-dideoxygalactose transaminase